MYFTTKMFVWANMIITTACLSSKLDSALKLLYGNILKNLKF